MADIIDHRLAAAKATIRLVGKLAKYYTSDEIVVWLESPQPQIGNQLPADLIASGRGGEIHAALDRMEDGVYI